MGGGGSWLIKKSEKVGLANFLMGEAGSPKFNPPPLCVSVLRVMKLEANASHVEGGKWFELPAGERLPVPAAEASSS